MGGAHIREGLELSDSETEAVEEEEEDKKEEQHPPSSGERSRGKTLTPTSLDEVDEKLKSLKLKYSKRNPSAEKAVKLYLHIGGNSPNARWITSEKLASLSFSFFKPSGPEAADDDITSSPWFLKIGSKVRAKWVRSYSSRRSPRKRRVDFVADGVWALKFSTPEGYREFQNEYQNCLFENAHGFEATIENKIRVFGNDFMAWARQEAADDTIWEDAEESLEKSIGRV